MKIPFSGEYRSLNRFPFSKIVPSASGPYEYRVTILDEYGTGVCQCKGFEYRHECKHLNAVRKEVLGEESAA